MNVSLPQQVEIYIQSQIKLGNYTSADQALRIILEAGMQALHRAANTALSKPINQRREIGYHLHAIEGNPLTKKEKDLFTQFDQQGLTAEQRIAYLKRKLQDKSLFAELA